VNKDIKQFADEIISGKPVSDVLDEMTMAMGIGLQLSSGFGRVRPIFPNSKVRKSPTPIKKHDPNSNYIPLR